MLYPMQELLKTAYDNRFAVGAFNVANSEFVKVVIDAAEKNDSPAIIQIHPLELALVGDAFIAYVLEAIHRSRMPMALHLDHGGSLADVMRAIHCGFNSVMIDASHQPYEENVALSAQVATVAHTIGVAVEAELGTVGSTQHSGEGGAEKSVYTNPAQAAEFVQRTGVDMLAVAIGTAHGIYPKTMDKTIRIDILKEIKANVAVPLVLHGGSDNKDDEIRATTQNGLAKVNLSTDMKTAFLRTLNQTMNDRPQDYELFYLIPDATRAATELVQKKMDLFGSSGKAALYR